MELIPWFTTGVSETSSFVDITLPVVAKLVSEREAVIQISEMSKQN